MDKVAALSALAPSVLFRRELLLALLELTCDGFIHLTCDEQPARIVGTLVPHLGQRAIRALVSATTAALTFNEQRCSSITLLVPASCLPVLGSAPRQFRFRLS